MHPTEILKSEHEVILSVLKCLEALSRRFQAPVASEIEDAQKILSFLQVFADTCHHGKEEQGLFKWMESRGFSRLQGPTGVMRREHDQGREWIRQMKVAVEASPPDGVSFKKAAEEYIKLLRLHIEKENTCLFPMADQVLKPTDEIEILNWFQQTEESHALQGQHEKFLKLAHELTQKYGVAEFVDPTGCGHAVCGCTGTASK